MIVVVALAMWVTSEGDTPMHISTGATMTMLLRININKMPEVTSLSPSNLNADQMQHSKDYYRHGGISSCPLIIH